MPNPDEAPRTEDQVEARLPWRKPEVSRLVVSFDTLYGPGSNSDCEEVGDLECE
jgi:hypothetical protein